MTNKRIDPYLQSQRGEKDAPWIIGYMENYGKPVYSKDTANRTDTDTVTDTKVSAPPAPLEAPPPRE